MKTAFTTLIAASVFASAAAFAEPTLVHDDAWLTGQKQSAPAPRAAATPDRTPAAKAQTGHLETLDMLAKQPHSWAE